MPAPSLRRRDVFLNIPYDEEFRELCVAYLVGVVDLGLNPVTTLGIPGGEARLSRIFDLMRASRHSIHDLSRVELTPDVPNVPRFNMPFELGMAVAWANLRPKRHMYFVFESADRRGHKSLSDMAGSDFYIHQGTPEGVMRELCSAFVRESASPLVPNMMRHYAQVTSAIPSLLRQNGTRNLFGARTFRDLVVLAKEVSASDRSGRSS